MLKKYDSFVKSKFLRESALTQINEGIFGKMITNWWNQAWYQLKKTFGDSRTAWVEYNSWCIQNGYNKGNRGEFAQLYVDGEEIVKAKNPKIAKQVEEILRKFTEKENQRLKKDIIDFTDEAEFAQEEPRALGAIKPKNALGAPEDDIVDEAAVSTRHQDINIREKDYNSLQSWLSDQYKNHLTYPDKMFGTFIWGAPGIGKTEGIASFCAAHDLDMMVWNLSTCEPTDFIGVPDIETKQGTNIDKGGVETKGKEYKRTINRPPMIFPPEDTNKGGILFLDELNRANKMVLGAALTLCNEGKSGMYTLPDSWQVIAAGNRATEADVTEMDMALANRFAHVNLSTTASEWVKDWALKQSWMYPDVVAFIQYAPEYFHKLDLDRGTDSGPTPAWPSPRNWELVAKGLTRKEAEKGHPLTKEEIEEEAAPRIGNDVAHTFAEFTTLKEHFPLEQIKKVYSEPDKATLIPGNLDLSKQKGLVTFITMYKKPKKKGDRIDIEDARNFFKYALRIPNFEIATMMVAFCVKVHPYINSEKPYADEFMKLVKEWHTKFKKKLDISSLSVTGND